MGFFLKLRYSTLLALGVLTIYIYTAKLTLQCLVDIQHHTYVQTILSCDKNLLYSLVILYCTCESSEENIKGPYHKKE